MGRGIIGEKGEGHQGTCIKDTWTKPKGITVPEVAHTSVLLAKTLKQLSDMFKIAKGKH